MDRTVLTSIKEAVDIVSVIGSYIELHPAGKWYKARCPFHNERTPSFHVSPDRGRYKCFGCGASGDVVTFVQEIEKISFVDAVKMMADRAGIVVSNSADPEARHKALIKDALRRAAELYQAELGKHPLVEAYLSTRKVSAETRSTFRIGFAPDSWNWLTNQLRSSFGDKVLVDAGLAINGKKGIYDRFRSRLMFPIIDPSGSVVGFTGRLLQFPGKQLTTEQSTSGKYINSPEGIVYQKSKILYGAHTAKHAAATAHRIVIVEGHFDALLAYQAGTREVVALSGTALTEYQIEHILKRYTDTIYLALDGDAAGIKSMDKAFHALVRKCLSGGFMVKMVAMPNGMDPADMITRDPAEWLSAVDAATDYMDGRIDRLAASDLSFSERERLVREILFPAIRALEAHGKMRSDKVLQSVARALGVTVDSVRADYESSSESITVDVPPDTDTIRDTAHRELVIGTLGSLSEDAPEHYQENLSFIQKYIPYSDPRALAQEWGIDYDDALFGIHVRYRDEEIVQNAHRTIALFVRNELIAERDRLATELVRSPQDVDVAHAYTRTLAHIDEITKQL